MKTSGAILYRAGLVTSVGLGAPQTFSSVRAGLSGFRESAICNGRFEPHVLALLPDEVLPPPAPALVAAGLTSRQGRLLRLAALAAAEALAGLGEGGAAARIPLFLATPERHPDLPEPLGAEFLDHLDAQFRAAGLAWDRAQSRCYPTGRAGGLIAVDQALQHLAADQASYVLAGGVDTCLDLRLLATWDREGRILGGRVMDGFIPGEGAGLLLLGRPEAPPPPGCEPIARILKVAVTNEPGHRASAEPYRGDGLAAAFAGVLRAPGLLRAPVATIFAGLNGENFMAKEFGTASLRSSAELRSERVVEHPADCFGDIGAALGPVLLALAGMGLQSGSHEGPALVWCSSEGPKRAAALMDAIGA